MRITFICDVFHPSSESTSQLFAELLNRLAADGLHCHVIANRLPNLRQRLATASPLDPKITVRRVGIPMLGRSSLLLRAARYLAFASGASMHLLWTRADRLWGGHQSAVYAHLARSGCSAASQAVRHHYP